MLAPANWASSNLLAILPGLIVKQNCEYYFWPLTHSPVYDDFSGMKAQSYQIIIQGLLDESWSAYLAGMTMIAEPAGVTRITGIVADQSALHGLLGRIRDLNLSLVSVQLLDSDDATPVECRQCRMNKPSNTTFDR